MPKASTKARPTDVESYPGVTSICHLRTPLKDPVQQWQGNWGQANWSLYNGSAKQTLGLIADRSVDCVVTSPPYYWLRDYKVDSQIGLEDSVEGYCVAIAEVMSEVYRVLKPEGSLFLNLGDTYYSGKGESQGLDRKSAKRRFGLRAVDKSGGLGIGLQRKSVIGIPWRVALKMCNYEWILRAPIVWHRPGCLPEPVKDRPSRGYEFVFMFVKSRYYYFNRAELPSNGGAQDVWSIPTRTRASNGLDTAPYPPELVEQCLRVGCPPGGTVLDPFSGSGTTLEVALKTKRNAIGIELNPDFCKHILTTLSTQKAK